MAAPNFRSASVSAPQTRQVSPPPSRFGASCAPPLRQNSLDSFRAKVKPLVIARPATADEAPGERHPLEIWEINYDEIFPNSARLAKQFAEKSLKLSSPPVPIAASPAASSVVPSAACASAARTAPQQLTPRDRVSEALPSLSPVVDNSSPLSELASPQSPPSITIPARALDDFTSPPSFPQLRARMLGCKLGTPCIVSLARTPGDPGAWDADDEEYESEESTRRRFRRSGSTGGSRHWVGEKVGAGAEGGNYKERARGPSPLSGRVVAGSCGSPQRQQHAPRAGSISPPSAEPRAEEREKGSAAWAEIAGEAVGARLAEAYRALFAEGVPAEGLCEGG
ncbi:unnamed protein product [Closterium sp. Naga37s-1]|nr:unnamed protein product [Closterium sp. Naga37s-1]